MNDKVGGDTNHLISDSAVVAGAPEMAIELEINRHRKYVAVDPRVTLLDLLRETKGAVDPRKFNTGRALANPVSRASLFFASESIPSAASKTRRSLPCAKCKSTVKKASEYII